MDSGGRCSTGGEDVGVMSRSRDWALDVTRLAELDMAWHGPHFIVWEFGLGVIGPAALGLLSLRYTVTQGLSLLSWPGLLGVELLAIALNYVPLLVQALRLRRDRSRLQAIKSEIETDAAEARSYGVRQLWILVPGAVVLFWLRPSRFNR